MASAATPKVTGPTIIMADPTILMMPVSESDRPRLFWKGPSWTHSTTTPENNVCNYNWSSKLYTRTRCNMDEFSLINLHHLLHVLISYIQSDKKYLEFGKATEEIKKSLMRFTPNTVSLEQNVVHEIPLAFLKDAREAQRGRSLMHHMRASLLHQKLEPKKKWQKTYQQIE